MCMLCRSGALKTRRWIADFKIYFVLGRHWRRRRQKMKRFLSFRFDCCTFYYLLHSICNGDGISLSATHTLLPLLLVSSRDYSNFDRFSNDFSNKRQLFSLSIWMRIIIIDRQKYSMARTRRKNRRDTREQENCFNVVVCLLSIRKTRQVEFSNSHLKNPYPASLQLRRCWSGRECFFGWFDILKETDATTFGWSWVVNRNPNIYSYISTYTTGIPLAYKHSWPAWYARDQQILMRTPLYLCSYFILFYLRSVRVLYMMNK